MHIFLLLIVIGAASGWLGAKLFKIEDNLPLTIIVAILGAGLGYFIIRLIAALLATKFFALIFGGVIGAFTLVYLFKLATRKND